jgi:hypothetical protein
MPVVVSLGLFLANLIGAAPTRHRAVCRELTSARGNALLQLFLPIDDDQEVRHCTLIAYVGILDHHKLLAVSRNTVVPHRSSSIQVIRLK